MKKLILVFILFPIWLFSFDGNKLFNKANGYFNAGQFNQAKEIYTELLDSGYKNATIYYNLGNTYYRLENIPNAVINYERAKLLDPLNEDINFNLKLANLKIIDKFSTLPKLFIIEWYENLLSFANADTWAVVYIISVWLTIILLFLTFWFSFPFNVKKHLFMSSVTAFVFAAICLFFTIKIYYKENAKREAIIFAPSVYIKSSPDNNATDLFILHEGTKIILMDHLNDWYEVKIQNGNVGWIQKNTFEVI